MFVSVPERVHATSMEPDLRDDLNDNLVSVGDEIDVEVLRVDASTSKVLLRDLGETEQGSPAA